jgi:WD40 repeat protein
VRVWDVSTGKVQSVLEGHTYYVNSVAFSSDGTLIVSGSGNNTVRVWDLSTGKVQSVLEGHIAWVRSVAFSSDGTRIVSGSGDGFVRVWDMSTGKVQSVLKGHKYQVISVAFSSDGTRIASGSADESVRVWDVSTGKVQSVLLEGHTDSVAFSSDGTRASGSADKSVPVSDLQVAYYTAQEALNSNPDPTRTPTGWLLNEENYVMFVPPRANLPKPPCILVLSNSPSSFVCLENAALGPHWHECYSPVSTGVESG